MRRENWDKERRGRRRREGEEEEKRRGGEEERLAASLMYLTVPPVQEVVYGPVCAHTYMNGNVAAYS